MDAGGRHTLGMTTSSPLHAHITTRDPHETEEMIRIEPSARAEPAEYEQTLDALERGVLRARFTLQRRANAEVIALYWRIGATILDRERTSAWHDDDIARLAEDLERRFPSMPGFSPSSLAAMRAFAAVWPERHGIFQQPVGQLPWAHIVLLLDRLDDQALREWYAGKDVQHTWSAAELERHIASRVHEVDDTAPGNFAEALAQPGSELADQLADDPDTTGFLHVRAEAAEGVSPV